MTPAGFPHSDICGSRPVCGSPQLFAAYHVLHRRSVPWHPPCALLSLIFLKTNLLLSSLLSLSRLFVLLCFSSMRFSRCVEGFLFIGTLKTIQARSSLNAAFRFPVAGLPCRFLPIDLKILRDALASHCLPRKEVIQPHLPIRLPCYDFTPVI